MNEQRRGLGYIIEPDQFWQGLLTGSSATLFTAPDKTTPYAQKAIIKEIVVANTDTVTRTYTLYVVASGGSVGDSTTIFAAVSIAANTTHRHENMYTIIKSGGTLRGLADTTNKVNVTVSGDKLL